ncbi:hypothetical protein BJ742DRAFT_344622 [Cladochytrium replicatum]|nr:hypothetical protein BJ742DRAFT_344622 [Cladochytrium replicatum]
MKPQHRMSRAFLLIAKFIIAITTITAAIIGVVFFAYLGRVVGQHIDFLEKNRAVYKIARARARPCGTARIDDFCAECQAGHAAVLSNCLLIHARSEALNESHNIVLELLRDVSSQLKERNQMLKDEIEDLKEKIRVKQKGILRLRRHLSLDIGHNASKHFVLSFSGRSWNRQGKSK